MLVYVQESGRRGSKVTPSYNQAYPSSYPPSVLPPPPMYNQNMMPNYPGPLRPTKQSFQPPVPPFIPNTLSSVPTCGTTFPNMANMNSNYKTNPYNSFMGSPSYTTSPPSYSAPPPPTFSHSTPPYPNMAPSMPSMPGIYPLKAEDKWTFNNQGQFYEMSPNKMSNPGQYKMSNGNNTVPSYQAMTSTLNNMTSALNNLTYSQPLYTPSMVQSSYPNLVQSAVPYPTQSCSCETCNPTEPQSPTVQPQSPTEGVYVRNRSSVSSSKSSGTQTPEKEELLRASRASPRATPSPPKSVGSDDNKLSRPTVYNESNLPTFTMDAGDVSTFMEMANDYAKFEETFQNEKAFIRKQIPCRNLTQTGACPYGETCWFNH